MKRLMLVIPTVVLLLAGSAAAQAAGPATTPASATPATFTVQGKILQVAKGRFQLRLTRVEKAAGLKVGQVIWIRETAQTKVMQAGKAAKLLTLKAGEQVEVSGNVVQEKGTSAYIAVTVQIVSPR